MSFGCLSPEIDIAPRPKDQVRLILVVAPTSERDVLDRRRSSLGIRLDVMELQEGALRASASVVGNEGTLPAVTMGDPSLHVPRDIPRRENGCSKLPIRPGTDRARR